MTQIPTSSRLLPLDQSQFTGAKAGYEYEPSPEEVLDVLLPKYAETLVLQRGIGRQSERVRRTYDRNGQCDEERDEDDRGLTLTYNRARQAAITQEIAEIVAGANAQQ